MNILNHLVAATAALITVVAGFTVFTWLLAVLGWLIGLLIALALGAGVYLYVRDSDVVTTGIAKVRNSAAVAKVRGLFAR